MSDPCWTFLALCGTAFLGGALNAIAGGGTLFTFPALTAALAPYGPAAAAIANATSTVALLPGSLAGAVGFRQEVRASRRFILRMLGPSLAGGAIGSWLVARYPREFHVLVPWLILTAAVLFAVQPAVLRVVRRHADQSHEPGPALGLALLGFQFLVAVYGGYFGAGIGILMLTALGFMGVGDIHRMNGVKTVLASVINVASVVVFLWNDMVEWRYAVAMAAAAVLGGYAGARGSRRLRPQVARLAVTVIGFGLAAYYFLPRLTGEG